MSFDSWHFSRNTSANALSWVTFLIVFIRPVEGLLEIALSNRVVGIILGIDPVADHKQLDIAEQFEARSKGMTVVTVGLVKGFFQFQATAFQFNLYQRQAIH